MMTAQKLYMRISALVLAAFILVLDQWSKKTVFAFLDTQENHQYAVTSFFNLVQVWNKGISFGLFGSGSYTPWIFTGIAVVISAILLVWLFKAEHKVVAAGLGLVIGGAIGNVIDRIQFGAVADFFDFYIGTYHWPAFNVADSAICVGVGLLILDNVFLHRS